MIRLCIGKMGSGKTASVVREMILNTDNKTTFSNIIIKGKHKPNVVQIKRDMVIKKELSHVQNNGKEVYTKKFNEEFWKETRDKYNGINVILDEAHTLIDSRRAMSKDSQIMNDFLALLRRILGDSGDGYGELILISQLGRRLDINARELATSIHYHICHYKRTCLKCNLQFIENNEQYEKFKECPRCSHNKMIKSNFVIEKFEFESMDYCTMWLETKCKSYSKHYYINDIEKYFKFYDTFQWENLISEY